MITISKSSLVAILERAVRVAPGKGQTPQLSHVALNFDGSRLAYLASDQRLAVSGGAEATGKPCEFTANARDLLSAVQAISGDTIKVTHKADHVTVAGEGKRLLKVRALPYEEYPKAKKIPAEFVQLPVAVTQLVSRIAHAAADERDDREHLRSVRLVSNGTGSVVATAADGRRACRGTIDLNTDNFAVCIPPGACKLLLESSTADGFGFSTVGGSLWFKFGEAVVECRTYAAEYPEMGFVFEHEPQHRVEFDVAKLTEAIGAVKRVDHDGDLVFTFTGSALRLESQGADGYAVDELECDGGKAEFGMSSRFLLEAIKASGVATITLGYSGDEMAPVTLNAPNWMSVISPLHLSVVRSKAKL